MSAAGLLLVAVGSQTSDEYRDAQKTIAPLSFNASTCAKLPAPWDAVEVEPLRGDAGRRARVTLRRGGGVAGAFIVAERPRGDELAPPLTIDIPATAAHGRIAVIVDFGEDDDGGGSEVRIAA